MRRCLSARARFRDAALGVLAIAASGCQGCHGCSCRSDHPYVPYAIESEASVPAVGEPSAATVSAATPDGGRTAFLADPATLAPPGLNRWELDDVVLQAPDGHVFVSALVRGVDSAGNKDVFAVVHAQDSSDSQLVYYLGRPKAGPLREASTFSPPPGLLHETGCAPSSRLVGIGKRSALFEVGAPCPQHETIGPDRWVALVRGGTEPKVLLGIAIADPPGSQSLSVDADTSDRDGDGLEDVALRVTIEGGGAPLEPGPRVAMTFVWLDRQAGLSRDVAATESAFASLAGAASARAARAKDAPNVPAFVAQVRALWRSACADGGAPRVTGVTGTGAIHCAAARALEDLGLAEVRAYVTTGDALRAALALDRAQRPPASRTGSRASDAERWLAQLAPITTARSLRAIAAVPLVATGHAPSWGSLVFEPSGKLLVRTRAGVVRVDPDAGDESSAEAASDWKTALISPDGSARWIEAYDPCDGLPIHATFASTNGDDLRDVPLAVAPPLGDRCMGSHGAPARVLPVAWGSGGIEAIVDGEPVLVSPDLAHSSPLAAPLGQPVSAGAPRSPDGKVLIITTASGLLVQNAAHRRLYRGPQLDGTYGEQRDCTVTNDGAHAACVHAGKAWVGTWDAL
jgi:hypothetical protein